MATTASDSECGTDLVTGHNVVEVIALPGDVLGLFAVLSNATDVLCHDNYAAAFDRHLAGTLPVAPTLIFPREAELDLGERPVSRAVPRFGVQERVAPGGGAPFAGRALMADSNV